MYANEEAIASESKVFTFPVPETLQPFIRIEFPSARDYHLRLEIVSKLKDFIKKSSYSASRVGSTMISRELSITARCPFTARV